MVRWLGECFHIAPPSLFESPSLPESGDFSLTAAPRADDGGSPLIVPAAVLGLFPINNQALIRDMEAMIEGESLEGPVRSFLEADATLEATTHEYEAADQADTPRANAPEDFAAANERLVAAADPCQAHAVRLARTTAGLVIHGPPGTGKSQTITNIVGDHLLRGQRVLVVSDKRTALDVVADRLEHLGLGDLVAVVHDAGRDQRDLYRSVREQLENLADRQTDKHAQRELARIDRQLDAMRKELSEAWRLLHTTGGDELDFHQLAGRWLSIALAGDAKTVYDGAAGRAAVSRSELETHRRDLLDAFNKAEDVELAANPWAACVGIKLDDFLARSGDELRGVLQQCATVAAEADATLADSIPSFQADVPLDEQAQGRLRVAAAVEELLEGADQEVIARWLGQDVEARRYGRQRLRQVAAMEQVFREEPPDVELCCLWGQALPPAAELARQIDTLWRYLAPASVWEQLAGAAVALAQRKAATRVRPAGRPKGGAPAAWLFEVVPGPACATGAARLALGPVGAAGAGRQRRRPSAVDGVQHASPAARSALRNGGPGLAGKRARADCGSLGRSRPGGPVARRVTPLRGTRGGGCPARRHAARHGAVPAVMAGARACELCQGKRATHAIEELLAEFLTCETIVRIFDALSRLPEGLRETAEQLLKHRVAADESMDVVEKLAQEHTLRARLAASPELARLDGQRLGHHIEHYRELRSSKHAVVCAAILHRWTERQQQRLMASTRSRLNSLGADVRRRLTMQGNQALRLRKVIEIGCQIEEGDPLFDLCPVWMTSPETVAQIFPRLPMFDTIVFDEASQCRLEEALPVLTRGRRVVIAGDVKQLPPTRFFETAAVTSQDDDAETAQDWFELQQSDVEDLLTGALNLQVEQCYLDVHYRSRSANLIAFSNEQFYASRLQAIPGHPRNREHFAPISLYHAAGVYEDRTNRIEAEAVCGVVHDLLKRAEPPSIGIACFNTDQRDLISECLDELAAKDPDFATRLADARSRKGTASSEALFVKNLENVQGDERDHMVISTTYGPNPERRFYRRFGPLGRAGGGRRLNVLVTRARHEVHLITSIPPSVYRAIPPLAPGQTPNGGWLLMSYLNFAEQLADLYRETNAALDARDQAQAEGRLPAPAAQVRVHDISTPSAFAESVAQDLARDQRLPSQVYWGNDGFCVDVAIGHSLYVEDVTVGLLCDLNRYHRAADPIEWEVFRTSILTGQGWQLERIWTPQYFRDPTSVVGRVTKAVADFLSSEDAKNALRSRTLSADARSLRPRLAGTRWDALVRAGSAG